MRNMNRVLLLIFIFIGALLIILSVPSEQSIVSDVTELELIEFTYWISIKTEMWWRFAYEMQLKNNSDKTIVIRADIKYLNSEGDIIDSTYVENITLPADEERSITGHSLISVPSAKDVQDAQIFFQRR